MRDPDPADARPFPREDGRLRATPAGRIAALSDARRVVRPGGTVVAATLNRYSGPHDLLWQERYFVPGTGEFTDAVTVDCRHHRTDGGFHAYLHDPAPAGTRRVAGGPGAPPHPPGHLAPHGRPSDNDGNCQTGPRGLSAPAHRRAAPSP